MVRRALVIEDDEGVRQLLRDTLDREFEVETAPDGEAAWATLSAAADDPPDVVLLDVMMPGVDGFTLLRRIRDLDAYDDVPVLMVTARSREEEVTEALEAGATDFVAKPVSPNELLVRIDRALDTGG